MNQIDSLRHEFVNHIPKYLDNGVLYVSVRYATVAHLCCCGCGEEVVTPLEPDSWTLMFNGKSVTLAPSIGNYRLTCQSHYWIERNRVRWVSSQASRETIHHRSPRLPMRAQRFWRWLTSRLKHFR